MIEKNGHGIHMNFELLDKASTRMKSYMASLNILSLFRAHMQPYIIPLLVLG